MTQRQTYPSITSLYRLGTVQLLNGDTSLPYVEQDGQFLYFAQDGKDYRLVMTSSKDLEQEKESNIKIS